MSSQLRIEDACPHCGQLIAVQLAARPADAGRVSVPVIVDPDSAVLHASDPSADHPCPGDQKGTS